ncbi:MAG: BrnT family toxin [Treponema sp.]|nr:BrnT family toxin [Treponema sp.]
MEERRITWDEAKNDENKRKHKISFEVAQYVFSDPNRIWRFDRSEKNTSGEERWQTIGRVGKTFFVVYTEQEGRAVKETQIISARKAEKHERRSYNGYYRSDNKGWTKDT